MVNPILRQIKLSLHEELENLLFTDKARFKDSLKKTLIFKSCCMKNIQKYVASKNE